MIDLDPKLAKLDLKRKSLFFDFRMLFNVDLGILLYLLKYYPKSKYFHPYIEQYTIYFLKLQLLVRTVKNPISIFAKDEYKNSLDLVYKELIESHYEEILSITPYTDIFPFIYTTAKSNGYHVIVNCNNELEADKIKKFKIDYFKIVLNKDNIEKYNNIYIYDIEEILKYKGLAAKSIYIYDQALNFKDYIKREPHPLTILASKINEIQYITPYSNFVFPKEYKFQEVNNNG